MIKWNPFEDINALQEQINQLFEDSYRRPGTPRTAPAAPSNYSWSPSVEAWETDESIILSVDIPGITISDIDLQIEGDQLTVKGERKQPDDMRNYRRREKIYGPFFRAFNLTTPVDKDNVKATYKNGVLEVILPKTIPIKPKQIKIEVDE